MLINGFKLKTRIKELGNIKTLYNQRFDGNIKQFSDIPAEERVDLSAVFKKLHSAEDKIAKLQTVQSTLNSTVKVTDPDNKEIPLGDAVKLVSVEERAAKKWKSVSLGGAKASRYERRMAAMNDKVRDTDKVYAVPVCSFEDALTLQEYHSARAAIYRKKIVEGNLQEINLEIDPALFD